MATKYVLDELKLFFYTLLNFYNIKYREICSLGVLHDRF